MNMFDHKTLRNRTGPILSDGTAVRDLIDLDRREVSLRVLNDPEIHELELERIFGRSWVVVGHVAEIPKAGDYVLRYIGEDRVIVVRDKDGSVNILLNACSHRGMEVCRADSGNQSQFKCPYHGWVFDSKGSLLGAPYESSMYGDWDKSTEGYGLHKAKVAIQSGIIFGNFDQDAGSLDDYLGDFKYYLDFTLGDEPDDLIIGSGFGGQTARMGSNWKIMNDQFCGDHYHTVTTHLNSMATAWPDVENPLSPLSTAIGTSGGHVFWKLAQTTEEAQALKGGAFMRVVFPASGVGMGEVGGREGSVVNMAMFVPRGPTDCEMHGLNIIRKSRMGDLMAMTKPPKGRNVMRFGGPINDIGADDNVQTYSIQRAVRGSVTRKFVTMKYPARSGPDATPPDGLVGPAREWDPDRGYAYIGSAKDDNQWNWWRRYFDVLTADE
jgi:phenylpropionate dioxygenase-like ring-hydroxylating dioxygenase large terminal subunit